MNGTTPRILMCPPTYYGIEYEINPWMKLAVGADHAEATLQWEGLRRTLEDLGARLDYVRPSRGLPDLVFTANAGMVHGERVVLSRFRHRVRRGEEPHFAQWFHDHGFRLVELPEGMFFEGAGDALFCGETLFAGYRFRSDARSHHWIGERLGLHVLPMELVDPRFYHLDTCFCPLADDTAIYFPGAFDDYGRSVLSSNITRLVEASAEEAASFSCNAVVVGRSVVLNVGAPKLAAALRSEGYMTYPLPLTEFIKSGGSAKCLTLRLDGEEAASWKRTAPAFPTC